MLRASTAALVEREGVLDEDEQQQVVDELSDMARRQDVLGRRGLQVICVFLSLCMAYCLVQAPFATLRHQLRYGDVAPLPLYYAVSIAVYGGIAAISAVEDPSRAPHRPGATRWLWAAALGVAAVAAAGWCAVFYTEGMEHPVYLWLPFGPLGLVSLGICVSGDGWAMRGDLDALSQLKYSYKKV